MRLALSTLTNRTYFSTNHEWIDLKSGYSGVTHFIYENYTPLNSQFVPIRTQPFNVKMHQQIGLMSLHYEDQRENIGVLSLARGKIGRLNCDWDHKDFDWMWTHKFENIDELSNNLMEFDEYLAYIQSLH